MDKQDHQRKPTTALSTQQRICPDDKPMSHPFAPFLSQPYVYQDDHSSASYTNIQSTGGSGGQVYPHREEHKGHRQLSSTVTESVVSASAPKANKQATVSKTKSSYTGDGSGSVASEKVDTTHVDSPQQASERCDGLFRAKVQTILAERAAVLDRLTKQDDTKRELTITELKDQGSYKHAEPDAIEFHMRVSQFLREKRFFKVVKPGDIVEGHVISISHKDLSVRVTSFVGSHKLRELSDIPIKGLVMFDNLSDDTTEREKIAKEMQTRDVVQGVVISQQSGILHLSFRETHVRQLCPNGLLSIGAHLGYKAGKRPATSKQMSSHSDDFLEHLENDPGFSNPSSTDNLKAILGIRTSGMETPGTGMEHLGPGMRPTLFRDIQMAEYSPCDYHQALRKAQRSKWSMDTVAVGVKHFKSGDHNKAMKLLNHALDIDPDAVEGLVARGALYANGGRFKDAIEDFEKALTIKHTHQNARKYLVETQVAYGEELEKKSKIEEAMKCYREALADDPSQTTARHRLEVLTEITEKQAAERREKERKKLEQEKTIKKIHRLLEKKLDKKSKKTGKRSKLSKKKKTKKLKGKYSTFKKHKSRKSRRDGYSRKRYWSSESDYDSDESTLSGRTRSTSHSRSSSSSRSRSRSMSSTRSRHRKDKRERPRSWTYSPSPKHRTKRSRVESRSSDSSQLPSPKKRKVRCHSRSPTPRRKSRSSRSKSPVKTQSLFKQK